MQSKLFFMVVFKQNCAREEIEQYCSSKNGSQIRCQSETGDLALVQSAHHHLAELLRRPRAVRSGYAAQRRAVRYMVCEQRIPVIRQLEI